MQFHLVDSQSLEPLYFNYSTENGLPSSECYEIIQDKKGYIWVSTDNGVSRFDGTTFKNFGTEEGLTDKTILFMHEDHRGWIWMSSLNANLFIYRGDTIASFPYNYYLQDLKEKFYTIDDFIIERSGVVSLSLHDLGLAQITPDGTFKLIEFSVLEQGGISYYIQEQDILQIRRSSNNVDQDLKQILYDRFTLNDLIYRSLIREEQIVPLVLPFDFDSQFTGASNSQQFAAIISDTSLLIRNYGQLYWFPHLDSLHCYQVGTSNSKQFSAILRDDDHEGFFVGYHNYGDGVSYFPRLEDFLSDRPLYSILPEHTISHLLRDLAGGVWIASIENGIYYLPAPDNLRLKNSDVYRFSAITSLHTSGSLLCASKQGRVLEISSNFQLFDHSTLAWKHGQTGLYNFSRSNKLVAISPLQVWNQNSWKFIYYNHPGVSNRGGPTRLPLRELVPSLHDEELFWGILGSKGLLKLRSNLQGESLAEIVDILADEKIISTLVEQKDQLWLGTRSGLFKYSFKDKQLLPAGSEKLLQERVEDIVEISDTLIAVATRGSGLYFLGPNSLQHWTISSGLASNAISFIRHKDSVLWFGSENGLHRVDLTKGLSSLYIYNKKDGLGSSEIIDLRLTSDFAWVLTNAGLTRINLEIPEKKSDAPLLISNILVNGQEHNFESVPNLSWTDNNIRVNFQFLSYAQANEQQYRYRVGPDQDWTYSNNNQLDLLNLSPDIYKLEIQAIDKWEQWVQAKPIQFVIRPPLWRTPLFYIGGILVLFLLSWNFFRRRIRQLSTEQEKLSLQKEVDLLKQQAYRAQMNPHFIFNCLSTIQGMIMGDAADKDAAVRLLANFSQLIRYALDASRQELVSLQDELNLLRRYIILERERFSQNFKFSIDVDPDIETDWIQIPPMLIQPYVENAILHGVADKSEGGQISLRYCLEGTYLKVVIEDNGPGIFQRQAQQKKKGGKYRHKSVGMMITKKRLEMLADGEYTPQIEEIKDDNQKIRGTRITLNIPL